MLLWTLGCRYWYLFELVFLFFSHVYMGEELLGHTIVIFLVYWETAMLFSTVVASVYIPINRSVPFFPHPCQYLLSVFFLIISILIGERWYLIVILIYISLMISDIEHLFMYLLTNCMSSLKNIYSGPLPIFFFF